MNKAGPAASLRNPEVMDNGTELIFKQLLALWQNKKLLMEKNMSRRGLLFLFYEINSNCKDGEILVDSMERNPQSKKMCLLTTRGYKAQGGMFSVLTTHQVWNKTIKFTSFLSRFLSF